MLHPDFENLKLYICGPTAALVFVLRTENLRQQTLPQAPGLIHGDRHISPV
jgi:hypothetical protein